MPEHFTPPRPCSCCHAARPAHTIASGKAKAPLTHRRLTPSKCLQDATEFSDVALPALRPLLASAKGEALLLLTKHAGLLQRAAPRAAAATLVPALLVRAAGHGEEAAHLHCLCHLVGGWWMRKHSLFLEELELRPQLPWCRPC